MKRVLICTIIRNQIPNLRYWYEHLKRLVKAVEGEYEVTISVYENDSTDGSQQWVDHYCGALSNLGLHVYCTIERLGTTQYGSIWSLDRLRNLANARQRCLDQAGDLSRFDKIAYIEPDVTYDPRWCAELILARHPLTAGLGEPDIYSGWSLRSEANPKESVYLYDTCATRATCYDTTWDMTEANGTWRAKTVVPTDLGGPDAMCLHAVWSTFNCFCVYNARLFQAGLKWGYVNYRLNTGQERIEDGDYGSGWLDADTACVCEAFHAHGHDKVYLNTNCITRHT